MAEKSGHLNVPSHAKVEAFAGQESVVISLESVERVGFRLQQPTPIIQAIYDDIIDRLTRGESLDTSQLKEIHRKYGADTSLSSFDFQMTSGRFTFRTEVPLRFIGEGKKRLVMDARLSPEETDLLSRLL